MKAPVIAGFLRTAETERALQQWNAAEVDGSVWDSKSEERQRGRMRSSKPIRAALVSSASTLASVSAVVLLTGGVCLAQVAGGTISGSVRDTSGSAIPRAQVAVKNSQMAVLRSVDADNNGIYTAPNLVPGTYEISASKKGFETVVRAGVTLAVGSEEVIGN
jgi:hypothetical protein